MPFKFGSVSLERLETVNPKLRRVVLRAIQLSNKDFSVLEGARTQRRQYSLYAQGRHVAELRKAGVPADILAKPGEPKVTWTLKSNHFVQADGFSKAVDLVPYPLDWDDKPGFEEISRAMFAAAKELSVRIRWGADWDMDGKPRERGESDSPHFELV